MHLADATRQEILDTATKADNLPVGKTAVDETIARMEREPSWRGADTGAGDGRGRPPELDEEDMEEIKELVFDNNAKACVTTTFIQRKIKRLRAVSRWCISRALEVAGLKWLVRRDKRTVPKEHVAERKEYCHWILSKRQDFLNRFAYTDGTSFYLARTDAELADKQRMGLGKRCWRMASGKDGLFDENVGASMYAKAQGKPVKIWGLFANGRLEYWVLPSDTDPKAKGASSKAKAKAAAKAKAKGKKAKRGTGTVNMTIIRYVDLVSTHFAEWRRKCFNDDGVVRLVQDHEWCLWNAKSLAALKKAGFSVLEDYPKSSPDLNAIEGWWHRLKVRLNETAPTEMETRQDFLVRLRRTVNWLNDNAAADALKLCTNQKVRARDVLKLKGARTKW